MNSATTSAQVLRTFSSLSLVRISLYKGNIFLLKQSIPTHLEMFTRLRATVCLTPAF